MNKLEFEFFNSYLEQLDIKASNAILELQTLQKHIQAFKQQLHKRELNYSSISKITENSVTKHSQPFERQDPNHLIRFKDVSKMVGLSRSSIYKYIENGEFPAGIKLSERSVAWRRGDIEDWISNKLAEL